MSQSSSPTTLLPELERVLRELKASPMGYHSQVRSDFVNEFADLCWTHQDEIIAALSHVSETTAGSDWQEAMAEIAGLRDRLGKAFAEITRLSSASATPATRAAGNTSRSYFEGYRPEPILGVNGWMTANAIEGYLGEREGQPGTTPMAIPFTLFEWRDILTALRAATDSRGQHG